MSTKLGKPSKHSLENISQFKDRPFLINGADGKVYSYGDVEGNVRKVAAELKILGIQQGDRIMLLLSNSLEFVFAFLGASFCDAHIKFGDVYNQVQNALQAIAANPKLIITEVAYAKEVKDFDKENDVKVMTIDELLEGCLNSSGLIQGGTNEMPAVKFNSDDVVAPEQQVNCGNSNSNFHKEDVILFVQPLRNAELFSVLLRVLMSAGAALLIMQEFDLVKSMELVEKFKVTIAPTPVVREIEMSSEVDKYDLSSIRMEFCTNSALAMKLEDVVIRARTLTSDTGSSCEAPRKLDANLQTSDTTLQAQTSHVIEIQELSFNSLKDLREYLPQREQEKVIKLILKCKKDIWKNQELFELVSKYFDNSLQTLECCTALEKCLERVRHSQLLILVALKQFEEETETGGSRFVRTLEELKKFKAAGDPFPEDFLPIFQSVHSQQKQMLEKLELLKNELNKKLEDIHGQRKVSAMIFIAACALLIICCVLVAAIIHRPAAAAVGVVASIPVGSVGKCINSRLKNREKPLKEQKEVLSSTHVGIVAASTYLGNIKTLIDRLKIDIEALLQSADFAIKNEAVKIGIDEIKKKMEVSAKNAEGSGTQPDPRSISDNIKRARDQVLQIITSQELTNEKSLLDDCC